MTLKFQFSQLFICCSGHPADHFLNFILRIICASAELIHSFKHTAVRSVKLLKLTCIKVFLKVHHRFVTGTDQTAQTILCTFCVFYIFRFCKRFSDGFLFAERICHTNLLTAEHTDNLLSVLRYLNLLMTFRTCTFFKHHSYSSQLW